MEAAFKEAGKALMLSEVPVGCVFVHNNIIISRASNKTNFTKNVF